VLYPVRQARLLQLYGGLCGNILSRRVSSDRIVGVILRNYLKTEANNEML